MFHIVESCLLTKLNGGLSRPHSAEEDAVSWLTNYGSWNAYEKKKNTMNRLKYHHEIFMVKSWEEFENGGIPIHCSTCMVI